MPLSTRARHAPPAAVATEDRGCPSAAGPCIARTLSRAGRARRRRSRRSRSRCRRDRRYRRSRRARARRRPGSRPRAQARTASSAPLRWSGAEVGRGDLLPGEHVDRGHAAVEVRRVRDRALLQIVLGGLATWNSSFSAITVPEVPLGMSCFATSTGVGVALSIDARAVLAEVHDEQQRGEERRADAQDERPAPRLAQLAGDGRFGHGKFLSSFGLLPRRSLSCLPDLPDTYRQD